MIKTNGGPMIQKELKNYLEKNILPQYEKNDWAHQIWHIHEVIQRSLKIAEGKPVNINMVYTIAVFHDIASFQGRKDHEKNSAKILLADQFINQYFTKEEIQIMAEAIIDHRASLEYEPRSIYGKIVSTADRYTSIKSLLRSTHDFNLQYLPHLSWSEMVDQSYQYIQNKYGKNGYGKIYFQSQEYENFQKEVLDYLEHPEKIENMLKKIDKFIRKEHNLPPLVNHDPEYNQKRYHTLDYELKKTFQSKVFKVSLNGGFSCPNYQNGHGCIFCSHGSGDFAGDPKLDLVTQFYDVKEKMEKKWPNSKYIAYFQADTNTYAPVNELKEKYESVLYLPGVVGLSIATRSDAITDEVLDYLEELNQKTYLTIELGLQSIHSQTLKLINRGHTLENFTDMVKKLQQRNIRVVVHIINGLPYETKQDMLETVEYLNELKIDGIKIHMLHILKNTPLANLYQQKPFPLLTKEEYIDIVCDQLERLNSKIVIHRLTGDPNKNDLIEPSWLLKKFVVLNDIDKELKKRSSYQGKLSR